MRDSEMQKSVMDDCGKRQAAECDWRHPVKTEIVFVDFMKIGAEGGGVSGKKMRLVKTYKGGSTKSTIAGQCMKKKGSWQWTLITSELASLLKEKKLGNFLKDMNSSEKEAIKKLNEEWNKVNVSLS